MGLIADLPPGERPRERLFAAGRAALADRELLALLLGTGNKGGIGAHELAERLLTRFGTLHQLVRAHPADLLAVPGVGPAKAAALLAAFELALRSATSTPPASIRSTEDIARLVAPLLANQNRELLVVVVCDSGNRVLGVEPVGTGSAERVSLPVREVLVAVLRRDGRSFALAHNHPGGDPTPSAEDVAGTRRTADAAKASGLRLLDHVVIAGAHWQRVTF
ncbi:JAB domain-containing protein [Gandjariella thermophila]|uniref:MPN domain-containing protein n=1 Tax=Gandjariella thermophila TaxID=1931992 RepID=A0A4D4J645_9PSEU|nr:DNA repair protein RadC [Gandjariella thermophila]GDY30208.1 hypothetical protein GTS_18410 [Gandjariella thermophila]